MFATVRPVNDAPSFTAGPDPTAVSGSGPHAVPGWATGFVAGPANEAGQPVLAYEVVSNTAPELFAVAPAVAPNGTLTFTPVAGLGQTRTATVGVRVRDNGGTANGGADVSEVRAFTITVTPDPPRVLGVRINDGGAQRSMVTSITVTFDKAVTFKAGAFELVTAEGAVVPVTIHRSASLDASGRTVAVLTFSGAGVIGGSLADGRHRLRIHADRVKANDVTMEATHETAFTRLFGDGDGDGDVDRIDRDLFFAALGSEEGDLSYRWYFDFTQDGDVDSADRQQFLWRL